MTNSPAQGSDNLDALLEEWNTGKGIKGARILELAAKLLHLKYHNGKPCPADKIPSVKGFLNWQVSVIHNNKAVDIVLEWSKGNHEAGASRIREFLSEPRQTHQDDKVVALLGASVVQRYVNPWNLDRGSPIFGIPDGEWKDGQRNSASESVKRTIPQGNERGICKSISLVIGKAEGGFRFWIESQTAHATPPFFSDTSGIETACYLASWFHSDRPKIVNDHKLSENLIERWIAEMHRVWQTQAEHERGKHPLISLVEAWMDAQPTPPSLALVLVTKDEDRRHFAKSSSINGLLLSQTEMAAVLVDNDPVVTVALKKGKFNRRIRRISDSKRQQTLFPIIGLSPKIDTNSLILSTMHGLPEERGLSTFRSDAYKLAVFGAAITHPVTFNVDEMAEALGIKSNAKRFQKRDLTRMRFRLYDALAWGRQLVWIPLPDGTNAKIPLINTFPIGDDSDALVWRIVPYNWAKKWDDCRSLNRFALTDGLRPKRHLTGTSLQIAYALDDLVANASGAYSANRKTPTHLVPKKLGGSGQPFLVTAWEILGRAQLLDPDKPLINSKQKKRWRKFLDESAKEGLWVAKSSLESPFGGSFEILDVRKASRSHPAAIWVRATARRIEAQRKIEKAPKKAFDVVAFRNLA